MAMLVLYADGLCFENKTQQHTEITVGQHKILVRMVHDKVGCCSQEIKKSLTFLNKCLSRFIFQGE